MAELPANFLAVDPVRCDASALKVRNSRDLGRAHAMLEEDGGALFSLYAGMGVEGDADVRFDVHRGGILAYDIFRDSVDNYKISDRGELGELSRPDGLLPEFFHREQMALLHDRVQDLNYGDSLSPKRVDRILGAAGLDGAMNTALSKLRLIDAVRTQINPADALRGAALVAVGIGARKPFSGTV